MCIRTKIEALALGVGRMFDFSGRLNSQRRYYLSVASDKIDHDALASDWNAVGGDLHSAVKLHQEKTKFDSYSNCKAVR